MWPCPSSPGSGRTGPGRRRGPALGPPPGGRPRPCPAAGAGIGEALIAPPPRRCPPWPPSALQDDRLFLVPVHELAHPLSARSSDGPPWTPTAGGRLLARGRPRVLLLQQALGAVRLLPAVISVALSTAWRSALLLHKMLGGGGGGVALSTDLSAALSEYSAAPSSKVSLLTFVESSTQTSWRGVAARAVACPVFYVST